MRQPFQVIVFPFRSRDDDGYEFLIGRRSDSGLWQAISGGGEGEETAIAAATRELMEETGLSGEEWIMLNSTCMLPKTMFPDHKLWTEHPYVIPEYAFGVHVVEESRISDAHVELRWCDYAETYNLLRFDSNRTALWELNLRIIV